MEKLITVTIPSQHSKSSVFRDDEIEETSEIYHVVIVKSKNDDYFVNGTRKHVLDFVITLAPEEVVEEIMSTSR